MHCSPNCRHMRQRCGVGGVASEDVTVTVEQSKAAGPSLLSRLAGLAVWVVAGLMLGWAAVWFAGRRRSAVESDAEVREITGVSALVDYRFGASRSARVVAAQLLAAAGPRRAIVLISARHIDGARQVAGTRGRVCRSRRTGGARHRRRRR